MSYIEKVSNNAKYLIGTLSIGVLFNKTKNTFTMSHCVQVSKKYKFYIALRYVEQNYSPCYVLCGRGTLEHMFLSPNL